MTDHFNDDYRPLVQEEIGEVLQAFGKCERFGADHFWDKEGAPNYVVLAHEIGGLLEVIDRLGLDPALIAEGRAKKVERLKIFGPEVWTPDLGDPVARKEAAS